MNGKNALVRLTHVAAALTATLAELAIFWSVLPK
jgi:hypothetical protein